jgi:hypothetical protein
MEFQHSVTSAIIGNIVIWGLIFGAIYLTKEHGIYFAAPFAIVVFAIHLAYRLIKGEWLTL